MHRPPHSPPRHTRRWTAALVALTAIASFGELVPNAPIPDFHLPVFDAATGRKTSDLRGASAVYHSRELIELRDFVHLMIEPDGSTGLEVRSPKALLKVADRVAEGDLSILVRSPTYEITGRDWRWEQKENHVVVRQDVRVTINATLGSFLK